jgi:hypothetical protein
LVSELIKPRIENVHIFGAFGILGENVPTRRNRVGVTQPNQTPGHQRIPCESPHPEIPEKAELSIDGCDPLDQELRIENKLTDEKGNEVKLKQGAQVDVAVVADPKDTTPNARPSP